MEGQRRQHVVQKTDARLDFCFSGPIEIQHDFDVGLFGFPFRLSRSIAVLGGRRSDGGLGRWGRRYDFGLGDFRNGCHLNIMVRAKDTAQRFG